MHYEGTLIRPPSEAHSLILQVTTGCSYNRCSFCGAYKNTPFRFKERQLDSDLDFAEQHCRRHNRVFLADGDVLILPFAQLSEIFRKIRCRLPWIRRISLYGSCRAIRSKSLSQMRELKNPGLDRIYMGLESGHDRVLASVNKGETAASMRRAAARTSACAIFLSVTVLLGIAGSSLSEAHAVETGSILSDMNPQQIAALTIMPLPGTDFHRAIQRNEITLPSPPELLRELKLMLEHTTADYVQFHANHASNYLHLAGRLQKDKAKMLSRIDAALSGSFPLVAEKRRSL
ncbi:MAG TPA: radical SAM protein [Desulfopila sp.]|nr:radical SAM protein [Desulfopila sp.]